MEQVYAIKSAIVPKKNSFRAGISKTGRLYQYRRKNAVFSEDRIHEEAKWIAREDGYRPFKGNVSAYVAVRKVGKADCIGKVETILDAFQGVAYEDDAQVVECKFMYDVFGVLLKDGLTAMVVFKEYENKEAVQ